MAWFKRQTDKLGEVAPPEERTVKTEGIFVKCENEDCGVTIYRKDLKANLNVCPTCRYHFRLSARERVLRGGCQSRTRPLRLAAGTGW